MVLKEIAAFIKSQHANEMGIIYCFVRAHCEQVAQSLRDNFDLRAEYYHAGMPQTEKKKAQDQWQSGEAQIIVSTVGDMLSPPVFSSSIFHSRVNNLLDLYIGENMKFCVIFQLTTRLWQQVSV